jgi:hypothetical protein
VPFHQEESDPVHHNGCGEKEQSENPDGKHSPKPAKSHPRNYSWAELMKRVWDVDVLKCDRCGGRMRILCAIKTPEAIVKTFSIVRACLPVSGAEKLGHYGGPNGATIWNKILH